MEYDAFSNQKPMNSLHHSIQLIHVASRVSKEKIFKKHYFSHEDKAIKVTDAHILVKVLGIQSFLRQTYVVIVPCIRKYRSCDPR